MKSAQPPFRRSILSRHLPLAGLMLVIAGPALAEADDPVPYYIGISQTETADSNVFRLRDGSPRNRDLISSTNLLAGVDQPLGRGRFVADLKINDNNFKNNKQLNYTGSDGRLRLDWETINRISGDISAYRSESLYRSDPSISNIVTERDVMTNVGGDLHARIGLVTLWTLEGGASYKESRHSSRLQRYQDLDQTSANLGVRMRPSDLWSVRLGVRETRAKYLHLGEQAGLSLTDDVNRHDIDLSGDWKPTGATYIDGRISSTRENHSLAGMRDAHYVTGLLGYNWQITGKTRLRLQLSRDSNVGNTDSEFRLAPNSDPQGSLSRNDSSVRNTLLLRGNWNPTAKIGAEASYSYSRRKIDNNQLLVASGGSSSSSSLQTRDRLNTASLGLTYRPSQSLLFSCKVSHEQRSADANATTTYPYKVDTGSCSVQFRI